MMYTNLWKKVTLGITTIGLWSIIVFTIISTGPVACSLNNLLDGSQSGTDSTGTVDPNVVTSYTGALGMYYATIVAARQAISSEVFYSAVLTDEISARRTEYRDVDSRLTTFGPAGGIEGEHYNLLQAARVQAAQTSAALLKYGPTTAHPLVGHAYALQAQMIVLLAETFCSGIPLTEAPMGGILQYTSGYSTTELLERAIALFDTAYQYGKDSLPIATFAKVGKGRALLNLGKYAEARAAVSDVATDSKYILDFPETFGESYIRVATSQALDDTVYHTTRNFEGINGLRWVAPAPAIQDPRISFQQDGSEFTMPYRETKYGAGRVNVPVADGIQARLIEAEAQLQPVSAPSGPWLQTLNAVRATLLGNGVRLLADTTDPGTQDGRINLLFHERAFWFFLNGTRLGDMRRLVRQYSRRENQVYPTGPYPSPTVTTPSYGTEVLYVAPASEQQYNPLYKGCLNRRA